ncbi:hypothetical protein BE04_04860 [Sorangium cellulosum]|uniref:Nucleoside phosphorylase domain-containing protein n=1 Tax=Sorangium cellulosum TaxID=56 RepID=A0A150PVB2_SORCE|nr:hypothetical protein BE04_04860 [Sorangium cellulosum]
MASDDWEWAAALARRVTVGIVTALPEERVAMLAMFDRTVSWSFPGRGAGLVYDLGELPADGGGRHVVAVAIADMGTNIAAARGTLLLQHFPGVEAIIMVGIAGGVPNPDDPDEHVRLGDVVVSDRRGVIQYDFLKKTRAAREVRASPRPPHARLLEAVRLLESDALAGNKPWEAHVWLAAKLEGAARPAAARDVLLTSREPFVPVKHPVDGKRSAGQPRIFTGAIASANVLLKDPVWRDRLRDAHRVKAVEMEASGIADATWVHGVGYLVVRGICDYCDRNKNDDWHMYAAVVAAAYVRAVLGRMASWERGDPGPWKRAPRRSSSLRTRRAQAQLSEDVTAPRARGPALPAIEHFVGRTLQVEELAHALLGDPAARIIVLGAGGIGKTTLTLAALHRREVEERYGTRRWFVRLDAAYTADDAARSIREVLGVSSSGDALAEATAALANAPGVLVLDNLETPWERELVATEALLGALAQIPSLRIVASARGGHKPAGVAWSKAIQLAPFSLNTAEVLFGAIASEHAGDARVRPLLAKLGGVPLAIVLLARAAEGYDLDNLAADLRARRTALLERRQATPDRLSSWAASVELSLASRRMTPGARRLGALLAALPGGIAVTDLEVVFAGGRDAARVLSQVGLAFFEGGRLQMLAPIREHMRLVHRAAAEDLDGAIAHYGKLARQLASKTGKDPAAAELARLAAEAPNMRAMSDAAADKGNCEMAWEELMLCIQGIEFNLADVQGAQRELVAIRSYEEMIWSFRLLGSQSAERRAACAGYEAAYLLKIGDIELARSEVEKAYDRYQEAMQIYKQVNDVFGEARAIARQKLAKQAATRHSGRPK